jgi:hypothetical protein
MRKSIYITLAALLIIFGATATIHLSAQQKSNAEKPKSECPMMKEHNHDMAAMNERGDKGMGFSQAKTTHHFYLTETGGAIQVKANDPKDTVSRDEIRQHLSHIAMKFKAGDFDIPMFVHDQVPPGVPVMQLLKADIIYKYEETEAGGRVSIASNNSKAVAAIQEFLKFQIKEHQTGDSLHAGKH